MNQPLVEAIGVKKYFKTPRGMLHAVEDVNFKIYEGKTLGVVGENLGTDNQYSSESETIESDLSIVASLR